MAVSAGLSQDQCKQLEPMWDSIKSGTTIFLWDDLLLRYLMPVGETGVAPFIKKLRFREPKVLALNCRDPKVKAYYASYLPHVSLNRMGPKIFCGAREPILRKLLIERGTPECLQLSQLLEVANEMAAVSHEFNERSHKKRNPKEAAKEEAAEEEEANGKEAAEESDEEEAAEEESDKEEANEEEAAEEESDKEEANEEEAADEEADKEEANEEEAADEEADKEEANGKKAADEEADKEEANGKKAAEEKADEEEANGKEAAEEVYKQQSKAPSRPSDFMTLKWLLRKHKGQSLTWDRLMTLAEVKKEDMPMVRLLAPSINPKSEGDARFVFLSSHLVSTYLTKDKYDYVVKTYSKEKKIFKGYPAESFKELTKQSPPVKKYYEECEPDKNFVKINNKKFYGVTARFLKKLLGDVNKDVGLQLLELMDSVEQMVELKNQFEEHLLEEQAKNPMQVPTQASVPHQAQSQIEIEDRVQVIHEPLASASEIKSSTVEELLEMLLKKHTDPKLTELQLADYMGFTEDEKAQLKLFWSVALEGTFLYLSDELILENLTKQRCHKAVCRFLKKVEHFKGLEKGVDFIELNKDSDLVKAYFTNSKHQQDACSATTDEEESKALSATKNLSKMTRKYFYAVSGETWKRLLMKASTKQCDVSHSYFVRIEKMARVMKAFAEHIKKREAEEQHRKDLEAEAKNEHAQENQFESKLLVPSDEIRYFSLDELLDKLLRKHTSPSLSNLQLAGYLGFTAYEKEMLKLFWSPAFNRSFIYLSDELILDNLTNQRNHNAVNRFLEKVEHFKEYKKGFDYLELNKDSELVTAYFRIYGSKKFIAIDEDGSSKDACSASGILSDQALPDTLCVSGKNVALMSKKYFYAVSGETFKSLLMEARTPQGKITRSYYIKVEIMAQLMTKYIDYIKEKAMKEEHRKELEEANRKLLESHAERDAAFAERDKAEEAKRRQEEQAAQLKAQLKRDSHVESISASFVKKATKVLHDEGFIYVGSNPEDYKNYCTKYGKSEDDDVREQQYHTGYSDVTSLKFLATWIVPRHSLFENIVRDLLSPWKLEEATKKEMLELPASTLKRLISRLAELYKSMLSVVIEETSIDRLQEDISAIYDEATELKRLDKASDPCQSYLELHRTCHDIVDPQGRPVINLAFPFSDATKKLILQHASKYINDFKKPLDLCSDDKPRPDASMHQMKRKELKEALRSSLKYRFHIPSCNLTDLNKQLADTMSKHQQIKLRVK